MCGCEFIIPHANSTSIVLIFRTEKFVYNIVNAKTNPRANVCYIHKSGLVCVCACMAVSVVCCLRMQRSNNNAAFAFATAYCGATFALQLANGCERVIMHSNVQIFTRCCVSAHIHKHTTIHDMIPQRKQRMQASA